MALFRWPSARKPPALPNKCAAKPILHVRSNWPQPIWACRRARPCRRARAFRAQLPRLPSLLPSLLLAPPLPRQAVLRVRRIRPRPELIMLLPGLPHARRLCRRLLMSAQQELWPLRLLRRCRRGPSLLPAQPAPGAYSWVLFRLRVMPSVCGAASARALNWPGASACSFLLGVSRNCRRAVLPRRQMPMPRVVPCKGRDRTVL